MSKRKFFLRARWWWSRREKVFAQYIVHLAQGGNAGELSSQLPHLDQALDEAWPEEMAQIREDA